MNAIKKTYWADKLGAISAVLCIIHCLTVPSLLALGIGFVSHSLVAVLFIIIAFISVLKVTQGRWRSGIDAFLWFALIGFVCCLLLEEHSILFEYGMFGFSTAIIAGHLYNIWRR